MDKAFRKGENMFSVLILDDNKPVAMQIYRTIPWDEIDCQVVGVLNDGLSGRETIERLKPDLIITDIEMPGLSGLQMIEVTQKYIPNSKLIFISAYDKFSYAHQALKFKACDYLLKPFTQSELRHAVDIALEELSENKQTTHQDNAYSPLMNDVLSYLKNVGFGQVTMEMVAEHFDMSPSKLDRLIKKETNMRYSELIAQIRIERAKELLDVPYLNISDIASRVGYSDYLTFYKVFVRSEKISPTEYRKNLNGGKDYQDED